MMHTKRFREVERKGEMKDKVGTPEIRGPELDSKYKLQQEM